MQTAQSSKKHHVPTRDRLIDFIGLDTYLESGGSVSKDLDSDAVYCNDTKLVHKLTFNALHKKAETVESQGWGWVHVDIDFPWNLANGMKKIEALSTPKTDDFNHDIIALEEEILELESYSDSAKKNQVMERFTELVSKQNRVFAKREEYIVEYSQWDEDKKALAGCIVSLSPFDGVLEIRAGFVKTQDFVQLEKLNSSPG